MKSENKIISRTPLDVVTFKNKKNRINLVYDRHFENYEVDVIDLDDDKLESAYTYAEIIREGFEPQMNQKMQFGTQPKQEPLRQVIDKIETTLKDATNIQFEAKQEDENLKVDQELKKDDSKTE